MRGTAPLEGVFTLRITLGNDAMSRASDVVAALREVAARIERVDVLGGSIRDANGNTVGRYKLGELE